jgi:hypothetical protein
VMQACGSCADVCLGVVNVYSFRGPVTTNSPDVI